MRLAPVTSKVIITDVEDFNLKVASGLGGIAVNVKKNSLEGMVDEITGGKGADVVVIATGEKSLVDEASKIAKKGARVIIPAIFDEPVRFDTFRMVYGEQCFEGSWAYVSKDFHTAIKLLASRKLNFKTFITHRFDIEDAERAFETIDKKKEKIIKAVFIF